ncbi:hypothetical protein PM082_013147 [Marasmius tenuissimus]|nr:hypothetical protein PM082_013147 [Marasmius tenuissimus]
MSQVIQFTGSWPSFPLLRKLVIFGDSYSSVGFGRNRNAPNTQDLPQSGRPLGVSFPGDWMSMWNEPGTPNWVGYFITKYGSEPLYNPEVIQQSSEYMERPYLIYDYAKGGDTVTLSSSGGESGLAFAVEQRFLVDTVKQHKDLTFEDALFVCWIGINDCAYSREHAQTIDKIFSLHDRLYKEVHARNFMFVDVPPIERTPAVHRGSEESAGANYTNWNTTLQSSLDAFAVSHPDSTVLLYSSHALFTRVLDSPTTYGFEQSDAKQQRGRIWRDHLHPTTRIHDILAEDIASFLKSVRPAADGSK